MCECRCLLLGQKTWCANQPGVLTNLIMGNKTNLLLCQILDVLLSLRQGISCDRQLLTRIRQACHCLLAPLQGFSGLAKALMEGFHSCTAGSTCLLRVQGHLRALQHGWLLRQMHSR